MSTSPVAPVAATAVPVPAPKLNAIQILERDLAEFIRNREQAIANLHAVNGAIQGAERILADLKTEAAKAETVVKTVAKDVASEATKVVDFVKKEVEKV